MAGRGDLADPKATQDIPAGWREGQGLREFIHARAHLESMT